jgi:hypothetical protein
VDWLTFIAAMTKALAWPLTAMVLAVSAIKIFREPISDLIGRISKLKFGRVSVEAKASKVDAEIVKLVREITALPAMPGEEHFETRRLVIRDSKGLPRIIAGTVESGEPFLALIDEEGAIRASLSASSAADSTGVAMLWFPGKGRPLRDMASFIGAESTDGSGAVGIRDSSGTWKEMS